MDYFSDPNHSLRLTAASYWDQVDEIDLEGLISGLTGESIASDNKQKCCTTNKMMVGGASWPSYDIEDKLC